MLHCVATAGRLKETQSHGLLFPAGPFEGRQRRMGHSSAPSLAVLGILRGIALILNQQVIQDTLLCSAVALF